MNTFWNFLDYILPPVRVINDLEDSSDTAEARSLCHPDDRIEDLEIENADLRKKLQRLERDLISDRRRLESAEKDLDYHIDCSARASSKNEALQQTLLQNQETAYHLQTELNRLRAEHQSVLSTHAESLRSLQERGEEVKSLKTFLSKTDEWSGAQVLQVLQDLNAEIVQLSAGASEEFTLDRRLDMSRPSDRELITASLGPLMLNLLASRDHSLDPTIVQFAIQAWEVHCCTTHLSSFCFGLPPEVDSFLTKLSAHMHTSEPQPTSSRWRALTHMHARALLPPLDDARMLSLVESNVRGLIAILAVSGCTDSDGVHRDPLRTRFGAQLSRIADTTRQLARAIKEGIMSSHFEVVSVSSGSRFERSTMENVYAAAGGGGTNQGGVLCTVELGLVCRTNRRINGQGSGSTVEKNLLLQPKVLLDSVAEIL